MELQRLVLILAALSCAPVAWLHLGGAADARGSSARAEAIVEENGAALDAMRSELEHLKFALETSTVPKRKFDSLKDKALQISGDLLRVRSEVEQYKEAAKTALSQGRVISKQDSASASRLNATFRASLQSAKAQIDRFREHNAQLELANERLEQQLTKASQDLRTQNVAAAAEEALQAQEAAAKASDEEVAKLRAQVESLRAERDQALALHEELPGPEPQPADASGAGEGEDLLELESDEALQCEESLREVRSVAKALKERVKKLESERDLLRNTAKGARGEAEAASEALAEARAQVGKLQQEASQKGKALADANARIEELQSAPATASSGVNPPLQPAAQQQQQPTGNEFASIGFGSWGQGNPGGYPQQHQQQPQGSQQVPSWQEPPPRQQQQQQQQLAWTQQQQQPAWQQQQQQQNGGGMYAVNQGPMMGMQGTGGGVAGGYNAAGFPQAGQAVGPGGGMNFGGPRIGGMASPCDQARNFEFDTDRPGQAFHSQSVRSARECRKVCEGDYRCRSWVYTKSDAMCFLKEVQNPAQRSACCVSGLRCG